MFGKGSIMKRIGVNITRQAVNSPINMEKLN